ncbi:MAG: beta-galactosidase [Blautia sp.]|nr:beta-galactosidase [Blautia sp.]MCM1200378.1 beta-galactosidase [Bacteroides fragilis]
MESMKEMTMGTCYYPEHWNEELWASDLERMKEAGITVIRIAEFAWNKIEPREKEYDFSFFDRFLDLCLEKKMNVIFSTPTATPPAWLTEAHEEALNARMDGTLYRHGCRKHYNYNSPVYQEYCREIVTRTAMHYGPHPAVIGWQIDNELNCEIRDFYSEADDAAFRIFLQEKYGTLDALNAAWGAVFWNQTYTDWKQVHLPRPVPADGVNPHLKLDYCRFVAESTFRFCKMQADILRKYCKPGDFITTNGMFPHIDNHRMAKECLDIYLYDSYPNFAFGLGMNPGDDPLNDRWNSKNQNEVRSICPHYGIMEQQSGAGGWTNRMEGPAPRPGQLTLWAMQSVAHGADFISFFRWRTCTFGTEIYWHGILDYDNRDNRKLREVKEFYRKFRTLDPVCGADYVTSFGLLKDYDNLWDMEADIWHGRIASYSDNEIFAGAELSNLPYDIIYLQNDSVLSDLSRYPVLLYPHPVIMTRERAALLTAYVEQGGTLLVGCRSGLKNANGICEMLPQPGLLQELTGTDIRDFTYTSPAEEAVYADWNGARLPMPVFNDILTPLPGADVLARYKNSYYAGEAALTERRKGKGRALHLGSAISRDALPALLAYMGARSPFAGLIEADGKDVELTLRRKQGREFLFVLNFRAGEASYTLLKPMRALFTNEEASGIQTLPAFGTAVYEVL